MRAARTLSCAAILMALSVAGAEAAPQMLALLSTGGAKALHCKDGTCKAEFSALCLQEERKVPLSDTAYELVGDGEVTLVLTAWDGAERRLPLSRVGASIRTLRQYSAIEIAIPAAELAARAGVTAAIEVGPRVTLIPEPVPDDPEPHTYAEILEVTGSQRVAAAWIDRALSPRIAAIHMTSALINQLADDDTGEANRADLLRAELVGRYGAEQEAAMEKAIAAYSSCRIDDMRERFVTIRRCLQSYHDHLVTIVNVRYWNQVGQDG